MLCVDIPTVVTLFSNLFDIEEIEPMTKYTAYAA